MSAYEGETGIEDAISAALRVDAAGALLVGWVVCAAYRTAEQDGAITHAYFTPDGQPRYSTVGLLAVTEDWLRSEGDDE